MDRSDRRYVEKDGIRYEVTPFWFEQLRLDETPKPAEKPKQGKPGFVLTSLADLLNEPVEHVDYVVDGLLPKGGASLLVANPKVGKTVACRNLALAVATGANWLGRKTTQGPVLLFALEEKRGEVQRHFKELGATGAEEIYIHCQSAPQHCMTALKELILEKKPVLAIVDTLFKLVRVKDGNDYAGVTAALEPVMDIARQTGAHLLLTHHAKKGDVPNPGDGVLGSQAIFAFADTLLYMRRSERYRTISSVQRYGDDMAETVLEFDPECRRIYLGEAKGVADQHRLEMEILEALTKAGEDMTERDLFERVLGAQALKRRALHNLYDARKVERRGEGKRGNPYTYARTGVREYEKPEDCYDDSEGKGNSSTHTLSSTRVRPFLNQPKSVPNKDIFSYAPTTKSFLERELE